MWTYSPDNISSGKWATDMIAIANYQKIIPSFVSQLGEDGVSHLQHVGMCELGRRAVAGIIVLPLCVVLVVFATDLNVTMPLTCSLVISIMVILGGIRGWAVWRLYGRQHNSGLVPVIFASSCLGMAACWGMVFAFSFSPLMIGKGDAFFFVMILTAGITTAAVTTFCIWQWLAAFFLLLCFVPGVVSALCFGQETGIQAVVAVILFASYLAVQLRYWHRQYWGGLASEYISELQAEKLTVANKELNKRIVSEKRSRQELENGREKLRHLFDNATDGFVVCNTVGRIQEVNATTEQITGSSRKRLTSMTLSQIVTPDSVHEQSITNLFHQALAGKIIDVQSRCLRQDLSKLPVQLHMKKIVWQDDPAIFVTLRDISCQLETKDALNSARSALQESEGYLQGILKNIELPVYCKDLNGRYVTVNGQFERLCSLPATGIVGKVDREIFTEDTARFLESRDGEVVQTGFSAVIEGLISLGGRHQNILVHKFPLKRSDGTIYGSAGICTDKTLMKKALQAAQAAQEAKTEFLAKMSHELRTPLHAVLSFARLGVKRADTAPREKLLSYFDMIVSSGDQLLDLLNDLFESATYEAHLEGYRFESANLKDDIFSVTEQFRAMMEEKRIYLETDLPSEKIMLQYDRVKMLQVLRNLLANAFKYSRAGTTVRLIVRKDSINATGGVLPAWRVSVVDQGIGVEDSECERIFEKFVQGPQSTVVAGGVGLGLSICRQVIEDHGGIIWARNNSDGGATFTFLIPAIERDPQFKESSP